MTTLARTRLELPVGTGTPTRLARGIWTPVADPTLADRCRRTLASLPSHCCVVGVTNAALRDLWIDPRAVGDQLEIAFLETGPCHRHTRSRRPEIRSSRRIIPADHVEVVDGIALASRAWTWRDLVTRLSVPAVVAVGDGLLRDGVTREELADVVLRRRGRPGTARAVRCLELLDGRSRSRPESHTRVELVLGGPSIPPFEVNVAVTDGRGGGWPSRTCRTSSCASRWSTRATNTPSSTGCGGTSRGPLPRRRAVGRGAGRSGRRVPRPRPPARGGASPGLGEGLARSLTDGVRDRGVRGQPRGLDPAAATVGGQFANAVVICS